MYFSWTCFLHYQGETDHISIFLQDSILQKSFAISSVGYLELQDDGGYFCWLKTIVMFFLKSHFPSFEKGFIP